MKAIQPRLFRIPTSFEVEQRRRGAPYEVQGRRWRAEAAHRKRKTTETPCDLRGILKRM